MIEFGKTLREAREAKGYTVSQLAEKTHIMHQIVEEMEVERFSRIPAPIYGRGFVKLYCEEVGLDPKPFIEAYMELQSGRRQSSQIPPPKPQAKEAPAPRPEPAPVPAPAPAPSARPAPPSAPAMPPRPKSVYAPPPSATPKPNVKMKLPDIPGRLSEFDPRILRIGVVVLAAVAVIWGLVAIGRALYRASMTPPSPEAPAATVETPAEKRVPAENSGAAGVKAAPRKPQTIPPLYID